jgi:hypothetical protein
MEVKDSNGNRRSHSRASAMAAATSPAALIAFKVVDALLRKLVEHLTIIAEAADMLDGIVTTGV